MSENQTSTTQNTQAPSWEQMKEMASSISERALTKLCEEDRAIFKRVKAGESVETGEIERVTKLYDQAIDEVATRLNLGEEKGGTYIETLKTDTMGRDRLPNEIDLVQRLLDILKDCNHPNPEVVLESQHIRDVADKNSNIQQMNINRFFIFLACDLPDETRTERYLLQDNLPAETWLENMRKVVVPAYIALGII